MTLSCSEKEAKLLTFKKGWREGDNRKIIGSYFHRKLGNLIAAERHSRESWSGNSQKTTENKK